MSRCALRQSPSRMKARAAAAATLGWARSGAGISSQRRVRSFGSWALRENSATCALTRMFSIASCGMAFNFSSDFAMRTTSSQFARPCSARSRSKSVVTSRGPLAFSSRSTARASSKRRSSRSSSAVVMRRAKRQSPSPSFARSSHRSRRPNSRSRCAARAARRLARGAPPLVPPPFTKSADVGRKPQRVPYHPDQKVAGRKGDDKKHGKQIERDLGAPRMEHEQGVAVVGPQRERKRDRKRERGKQPQQALHRAARSRDGL